MANLKQGNSPYTPTCVVYVTKNIFIRYLGNRFCRRVKELCQVIEADRSHGLDVGCGEGHLLNYLSRSQAIGNLVGVDLNENKLRYAARKWHAISGFVLADIQQLSFKARAFDYIIATEVLEHIPDAHGAMRELQRLAKFGGHLIVSIPHEPFFHLGNLVRGKYIHRAGRTPTHVNFWRRSQFRKFLNIYCDIEIEKVGSTFPWLLYLCRFK